MNLFARRWLTALRYLCAATLLAACGGGVETGGTGPTGSAFVEGPVTGFGSIIVRGIRFDDNSARIEDADGRSLTRDTLRLGMVVEVEGSRSADDGSGGRNATATRVRLTGELLGPVQAVGLPNTGIRVLGQAVRVTPATVLEGLPGGIGSLQVNDIVEVNGFLSPDGVVSDYVATRIQRRGSAPANFRVRGVARDVDAAARTLRVGLDTFDLSAVGLPAGLIGGTSVVRMTLDTAQVAARWPVRAVVVEQRNQPDREEAEIEGLITAFSSAAQFSVNGFPVNASGAAFPNGTAGLGVGSRVEVQGRFSAGTLVAARVELRNDDDVLNDGFDLRDRIASLDTTAKTFSVRGVSIFYGTTPPPRFDNGTEANLANGACVRVRARLDVDRVRILATRIDFSSGCGA